MQLKMFFHSVFQIHVFVCSLIHSYTYSFIHLNLFFYLLINLFYLSFLQFSLPLYKLLIPILPPLFLANPLIMDYLPTYLPISLFMYLPVYLHRSYMYKLLILICLAILLAWIIIKALNSSSCIKFMHCWNLICNDYNMVNKVYILEK